ncbi:MAG: class I SAM-dependent methyltransferase [Verrucomicrobiota bacterium]
MSTLHRILWLAPKGHGKPISREKWEEEYRAGVWNYLNDAEELARYMVIVGYATQILMRPRILDIGCGHGRLLQLLPESSYQSYLGVDISDEAIRRAKRLKTDQAEFYRADFEAWCPPHSVDLIIFNESLYNSRHPIKLIEKYLPYLLHGGRIIISMFNSRGDSFIWRRLDAMLQRLDGLHITHDNGRRWQVALFAQRETVGSAGTTTG